MYSSPYKDSRFAIGSRHHNIDPRQLRHPRPNLPITIILQPWMSSLMILRPNFSGFPWIRLEHHIHNAVL